MTEQPKPETPDPLVGTDPMKALVIKCQAVLTDYLSREKGHEAVINDLLTLLDGPEWRTALIESDAQRAEIERLKERIEDYEDSYRCVIDEKCAGDEMHCTCVPNLRRRIAELEKQLAEAKAKEELQ